MHTNTISNSRKGEQKIRGRNQRHIRAYGLELWDAAIRSPATMKLKRPNRGMWFWTSRARTPRRALEVQKKQRPGQLDGQHGTWLRSNPGSQKRQQSELHTQGNDSDSRNFHSTPPSAEYKGWNTDISTYVEISPVFFSGGFLKQESRGEMKGRLGMTAMYQPRVTSPSWNKRKMTLREKESDKQNA